MAPAQSWLFMFSTCFLRISALLLLHFLVVRVDALNRSDEVQILMNFKTQYLGDSVDSYMTFTEGYWNTWKATDESPCAWVGVTCTDNFTVEELNLAGWGPPVDFGFANLSKLPDLRRLDLSSNNLAGNNDAVEFTGDVGDLTRLTWLDLSRNLLAPPVNGPQIPLNISRCQGLRYLSLEQTSLQGAIPNLTGLVNLQVLSLAGNQFTGSFPRWLGEMHSLVKVDLSNNMLNGTIPSLSNVTNLLDLNLDGNNFTSFEDPQFPIATSLQYLSVSGNQLEGSFPHGMHILNFASLNMSNNRLTGQIPSAPALQLNHSLTLDLSSNLLTGEIPAYLIQSAQEGQFVSLNLSHNNLSGNIPMAFHGAEEGLVYDVLDLSHNQLSGPISSICKNRTTVFRYLWLQNNQLDGDIVDLLADGSGLQYSFELRLQNNLFSGDLSRIANKSYQSLFVLDVLDLSNNNLRMSTTKAIPYPLTSLLDSLNGGYLATFSIGGNNFSGTSLPTGYISGGFGGVLDFLEILDFSNSHLHGEISSTVFNSTLLPALQILNLSNNEATGNISEDIISIPNLVALDVSHNKLSGPLPIIPHGSSLHNPTFFEGNALCGDPLPPCESSQRWVLVDSIIIIVSSVVIAIGSCLVATWRWSVYRKRHQQDADLIKTLMERESATLMSLRELKKATNSFSETAQIGEGGFGIVYKGELSDGTTVAIKRRKHDGLEKHKQEFLNEVRILSQVSHRNLVKLLGCCMENKVALLVFEFISNGTLLEHLQGKIGGGTMHLSWRQRLNIAVQTAGALDYLHSATMFPIYHRDVKSANILLTDELDAKVADFGISKLVPIDATHVSTLAVQGTMGYIDPEYYTSYQLTSKSDVYSFGVVLLELISAKLPIDQRRGGEGTSLVMFSKTALENEDLQLLIDPALIETYNDPVGRQSMLNVGKLAMQCLDMRSKTRPSMKEVWVELKALLVELDGISKRLGSIDEDCNELRHDEIGLLSISSSKDSSTFCMSRGNDGNSIELLSFPRFS